MSKPESKTATSPLCGDPARYDRGECNWPKCGCQIKDDAPTQTAPEPIDDVAEVRRRMQDGDMISHGQDAGWRLWPSGLRVTDAAAAKLFEGGKNG